MELLKERLQESSESIFNLTIEGLRELQGSGLDLNTLFILECFDEGTDVTKHLNGSKYEAWKQSLIRYEYLTKEGEVTNKGKDLLSCVKRGLSYKQELKKKEQIVESEFDEWWTAYPPTDQFTYKGRKFPGARGFRVKKKECKEKFMKIVLSKEHTAKELIDALKCEIIMKKEASIRDGDNRLKFMQNSLTYLNQCTYENFIELAKDYETPTGNGGGTFSI